MSVTVAISVLTLLAAIPNLGFVLVYFGLPWRKSAVGRGVMMAEAALTLLIGMGVLRVIFGTEYALKDSLLLIVYAVIDIGQWFMFIALLLVRRSTPDDTADPLEAP